jgi:serine/threonine-protein kinase
MPDPTPSWTPETDGNLLYGVLCLQADLIDEAQFAEACTLWAARKNVPLAELLLERGWISEADKGHIDFLVARKLQKHGDARRSLGAVADAGVRDLIRNAADPALRQSLATLPPAPGCVLVTTVDVPLERRDRYTLARLHGEGGLGLVYVAHDHDLNRDVALKEIRPERAKQPEAFQRFLKEAQLTGQLEHPNIVPVYEVACRREAESPFYTMRLVRGQTLREAIADHHRRRREGREDPLERLRLLGAFVSICQAISYAHSRGVVHRDLKPENVMLGGFGEVIVLDWGLAKMVDQPDDGSNLPGVAVTEQAQTEATVAGRVVGTPAYAAPEQAEGRVDLVDTRTDVYGLGTILFEILTGRPPHHGPTPAEVLRRITTSETPRARAAEPSVPRALDAICARAMAKKRGDRYARAADLAHDVQRFLADEPVEAYPEPFVTRAGRWARRHRPLVTGAAALLVAGLVFVSVLALLLEGARERTEKARAEAEEQRARAEHNFRQARKAVDDYFTAVSENKLLGLPHMEPLRKELLEKAREYYQQFTEEAAGDPRVRADHATAIFRVATLTELTASKEEARGHYQKAVDLYEEVIAEHPDEPEWRNKLARCYNDFGLSHIESGRMSDATPLLGKGRALAEQLVEADPKSAKYRGSLARLHLNTALWHYRAGDVEEAIRFYEKARQLQEEIVYDDPALSDYQSDLALTIMNLGSAYLENGRPDRAFELYEQTRQIEEKLVRTHVSKVYYQRCLGAVFHNLGMLHRLMSRPEPALAAYAEARKIRARLAEEHPAVTDYQNDLGETLNNIGEIQLFLHQEEEAQATLKQAGEIFQRLTQVNPTSGKARNALGLAHNNLGVVLHQTKKSAEALVYHEQAQKLREGLVRDNPEVVDFQSHLADTYSNLGNTLRALGRKDEALRSYEKSCALYEQLLPAHPTTTKYRTNLALAYTNMGYLHEEAERPEEALAAFERGRVIRHELADSNGPRSAALAAASAVLAAGRAPALDVAFFVKVRLDPCRVPRFEADRAQSHFYIGKTLCKMGFTRYRGPVGGVLAGGPVSPLHVLPGLCLPLEEAERSFSTEAMAHYEEALAAQRELVATCPTIVDYRADLGRTYIQIGNLYRDGDKMLLEAFKEYRKAIEVWKKVVADAPHVAEFRSNLAITQYNFGLTLQDLRLALAASRAHEEGRVLREKLVQEYPDDKDYRRGLSETYNSLGLASQSLRRHEQARDWFRKARAGFQQLVDKYPDDAKFRSDLGRTILNEGITLAETGKPQEAIALYQWALPIQRQAMEQKPGRFRFRELVSKTYGKLAEAYRALNHPAEAAAATLERSRLWTLYPNQLVETAGDLALCIPLVGKDKPQLTEDEETARRRLADQAMEMLRQAAQLGYRDWGKVKDNASFAPLRDRDEFQQLVAPAGERPPPP